MIFGSNFQSLETPPPTLKFLTPFQWWTGFHKSLTGSWGGNLFFQTPPHTVVDGYFKIRFKTNIPGSMNWNWKFRLTQYFKDYILIYLKITLPRSCTLWSGHFLRGHFRYLWFRNKFFHVPHMFFLFSAESKGIIIFLNMPLRNNNKTKAQIFKTIYAQQQMSSLGKAGRLWIYSLRQKLKTWLLCKALRLNYDSLKSDVVFISICWFLLVLLGFFFFNFCWLSLFLFWLFLLPMLWFFVCC